ncbi:GNAT family N-acetyltransferase [Thermosipho ferrireducens]|uniref:GNAT family N-acetyltransferase n=1 Tax=Thermosipho ferrireducens TaxID=2571116 RepID=A0ABX7S6L9_9BACT|nr:GNAT family N-acetyltransferase [Thermosipho ferrireducens]QTA37405.1 GNAT family N-acetyltransferase [Thermosipho ferrireducens]
MSSQILTFKGRNSLNLLKRCWAIRKKVFIEEQNVPEEEELDSRDNEAVHFLLTANEKDIGTCRVRHIAPFVLKVERVAIIKEYRGLGYGKLLMKYVEKYSRENKIKKLVLNSQLHVKDFYEQLGFISDTNNIVFYEAGIPHIKMEKVINL